MKQHDESKIELLIINKPSIGIISTCFKFCSFGVVELTFRKWLMNILTRTHTHTHTDTRVSNLATKTKSVRACRDNGRASKASSLVDQPPILRRYSTKYKPTSAAVFIRRESFSTVLEKILRDFFFGEGGGGEQNRISILSRWIFNATSKMYKIFIQVAKNYCKLYTYTGALLLCAIIFGYKMWCRRIFNVVPFHDALRYS